ncbi:MAG: hypothetical protein SW127_21950, partial [Actinomycetota bacterium]|nr:hypothetical protein [Actinomycetota bacterium]
MHADKLGSLVPGSTEALTHERTSDGALAVLHTTTTAHQPSKLKIFLGHLLVNVCKAHTRSIILRLLVRGGPHMCADLLLCMWRTMIDTLICIRG